MIDIQQGRAAVLTVVPPRPWASPSATLRRADRTIVAEGLVCAPSALDSTVASAADNCTLTLASVTGAERSLTIQVVDPVWGAADSRVASVDTTGKIVTLAIPLPRAPATGATVKGLDILVALTDACTELPGLHYVLDVEQGTESRQLVVNVCAYPFVGPMSEALVRDHIAAQWPGEQKVRTAEFCAEVAETVNRRVRARLLESDAYATEYWDHTALEEAAWLMLDLVLQRKNLVPPRVEITEWLRSTRIEIESRIGALLKSATPADRNRDGVIDSAETEGILLSRVVR